MVTNSNHAQNFFFILFNWWAWTNKLSYTVGQPTIKSQQQWIYLSPIDMVIFDELKKGKAGLKMAMKAFKKREKVEDKT